MPDNLNPDQTPEDVKKPAEGADNTPAVTPDSSPEASPSSEPTASPSSEIVPSDMPPAPEAPEGPTPEEIEHARRMKELFGDLDEDEDGNEKVDSVEALRAERDTLQAQSDRLSSSVSRTRTDNQALLKKLEDGKALISQGDAVLGADKKAAAVTLLTDMLPVVTSLEQGIKGIDPQHRTDDPKFDKLAKGMESTLNQLTAVFNKYGVKPSAETPDAPKADAPKADAPAKDSGTTDKPAGDTPATPAADAPKAETQKPDPANDTVESLKAERDALLAQIGSLTTTVSRAQTDNLTLTKRVEEGKLLLARQESQREEARQFAAEKVVKDLLPVIDTLELGLKAIDAKHRKEDAKFENLATVVEGTLKQVSAVFNKFGIEAYNPLNQPFDAEKHEAVTLQARDGVEPETVIHVAQKGYGLNGRLLRPAKVIVTPPE